MKKNRQQIYMKFGGRCAYCGCELGEKWHVDHIVPIIRNRDGTCHKPNDLAENCNPSCASCNVQKNSYTVEQFRENIQRFVMSLNRYNTQYKFAKKYCLIVETGANVRFYFETIEKGEAVAI